MSNTTGAEKACLHWKLPFFVFLLLITSATKYIKKLDILIHYVSFKSYKSVQLSWFSHKKPRVYVYLTQKCSIFLDPDSFNHDLKNLWKRLPTSTSYSLSLMQLIQCSLHLLNKPFTEIPPTSNEIVFLEEEEDDYASHDRSVW